MQPLTTVQQFSLDVFLFHVPYTLVQYCGLAWLFSLYIFQGLKFLFWDLPREKKRDAAKKKEVEKLDEAYNQFLKEEGGDELLMNIAEGNEKDSRTNNMV